MVIGTKSPVPLFPTMILLLSCLVAVQVWAGDKPASHGLAPLRGPITPLLAPAMAQPRSLSAMELSSPLVANSSSLSSNGPSSASAAGFIQPTRGVVGGMFPARGSPQLGGSTLQFQTQVPPRALTSLDGPMGPGAGRGAAGLRGSALPIGLSGGGGGGVGPPIGKGIGFAAAAPGLKPGVLATMGTPTSTVLPSVAGSGGFRRL